MIVMHPDIFMDCEVLRNTMKIQLSFQSFQKDSGKDTTPYNQVPIEAFATL